MRSPHASLLASLLALAFMGAWSPARATATEGTGAATWQFARVGAPAATPGEENPVPLGKIGEISFWSPNHGLLITGGSGATCAESAASLVPCGLYAYNGEGWHLLSNVCGGANGQIAWVGENEFWTISDQRPGQVVTVGGGLGNISLCHFAVSNEDGETALRVVGSYAMPLNQPNSYLAMHAAGCLSPQNCWFGGVLGQPPNSGAFHLHWDGEGVTALYAPADHAVVSMALANRSALLESVQIQQNDRFGPEESETNPAVLHQIDPPGSSIDFHSLFLPNPLCAGSEFCPPLPDYGFGVAREEETGGPVAPYTLAGFKLSSDYSPAEPSSEAAAQVWAVAGPDGTPPKEPDSEAVAHPIVLRYAEDPATHAHLWTQVVGGEGPGGAGPGGEEPFAAGEVPENVAAEPSSAAAQAGSGAAWVTVNSPSEHEGEAHVDRLNAEGKITANELLGSEQGVGKRGSAGPIACPAPEECWLATEQGWLFHLTPNGRKLPPDTDPYFGGVITFRPLDEGVVQLPPNEPPPDDSLANQQPPPPPPPKATVQAPPALTRKPLVTDLRSHVVHRYTLELSFKLTVKAHVQLLASHGRLRVAQTHGETLKAGRHTLMLRLNPHKWPNKLNLKATPLEALPTEPAKHGETTSGSGTVAPPVNENSVST
jgi:hypothetical protein